MFNVYWDAFVRGEIHKSKNNSPMPHQTNSNTSSTDLVTWRFFTQDYTLGEGHRARNSSRLGRETLNSLVISATRQCNISPMHESVHTSKTWLTRFLRCHMSLLIWASQGIICLAAATAMQAWDLDPVTIKKAIHQEPEYRRAHRQVCSRAPRHISRDRPTGRV